MEVWLKRDEAATLGHRDKFAALNASIHVLDDVIPEFPELMRHVYPTRDDKPFITKQIALVAAQCEECLLLDADNVAGTDPTFLFSDPHYLDTGLVLWPDFWHMPRGPAIVRQIFGLPQSNDVVLPDERTVESGQVLIDKRRSWPALQVAVRDGERERQRDRETERQTETERDRETERQRGRDGGGRHTHEHTGNI